jgi:hypothetical protein
LDVDTKFLGFKSPGKFAHHINVSRSIPLNFNSAFSATLRETVFSGAGPAKKMKIKDTLAQRRGERGEKP